MIPQSLIMLLVGLNLLGMLLVISLRARGWGWISMVLAAGILPLTVAMSTAELASARDWMHALTSIDPLRGLIGGLAALPLVGLWGLAVRWARLEPSPPLLDMARLRWVPRATHRPTWVLFGGLGLAWSVMSVLLGMPAASVVPLIALAVCWHFAHQGDRGSMRVEARDLLFDGLRIPLDDILSVERDVRLFPIWRVRIALERRDGPTLNLLVTGSPERDVDAVVRLLQQQHAYISDHQVDRGDERAPPRALEDLLRAR